MQVCSAKHSVLEISLRSVHKINSHLQIDDFLIGNFSVLIKIAAVYSANTCYVFWL